MTVPRKRSSMKICRLMLLLVLFASCQLPAQEVVFTGDVKLPRVARFRELPMRMVDELTIDFPPPRIELKPGLVEYFDKLARSGSEPELVAEAARSLRRIAAEDHGDISSTVDALESLLTHESPNVQRAAAGALIAADAKETAPALFKLSQTRRDLLRGTIEAALAKWQFAGAKQVWLDRLSEPAKSSSSMLALACSGLASLNASDAMEPITALYSDLNQPFPPRIAATRAIAALDPARARSLAEELTDGPLKDRLLAVSFLTTDEAESLTKLFGFCTDKSNAVAAAAWRELEQRKPELLKDVVTDGCRHPDTQVRLAAIRVIERYPSIENTDLLTTLTGDRHIDVRNNARVLQLQQAAESDELKARTIANAESGITPDSGWERIEQSLLILASLKQSQTTMRCVELLEHEHGEVYVTAAWVMHLYPNALVLPEVTEIAKRRRELARPSSPPEMQRSIGFQMAHLYQLAGYLEHKPFMDLCIREFNQSSGLNRDGRAAGMWAIGMLNRGNPDPDLVGKLLQRVNARGGNFPEFDMVRRMALMSVGRMMAKDKASHARRAYALDGPATLIPESARWVLKQFGEKDIPPERKLEPFVRPVGGWRVSPNPKKAD